MPRTERILSKTGIYHIMLRGINKQLIFEEWQDYAKFLSILAEVKQISDFKLFAYCLMGNHIHLLLKEDKEPIAQIFKRIGTRYAFWFNWKYERSGHLFQDRFRSEPIESDERFLTTLLYIYQNPLRAGLCNNIDEYEWSSRKRLGKCATVDETDLFEIIPFEMIGSNEDEEIKEELLEPRTCRGRTMTDERVIAQIKSLSHANSIAAFQSLSRQIQQDVIVTLQRKGVSLRQFARISGISRHVITRLCQESTPF